MVMFLIFYIIYYLFLFQISHKKMRHSLPAIQIFQQQIFFR